jgi:hypothetical protein
MTTTARAGALANQALKSLIKALISSTEKFGPRTEAFEPKADVPLVSSHSSQTVLLVPSVAVALLTDQPMPLRTLLCW